MFLTGNIPVCILRVIEKTGLLPYYTIQLAFWVGNANQIEAMESYEEMSGERQDRHAI